MKSDQLTQPINLFHSFSSINLFNLINSFNQSILFSSVALGVRFQLVGKANRRISNIEPQNVEGWFRFAQPFLK